MISLCSKSYIIQDSEGKQKISCKGISKKQLVDPMSKFRQTLNEKEVNSSINVGFRLRGGNIFTYSQERIGFSYFYYKRVVQYVFVKLRYEKYCFYSLEQLYFYLLAKHNVTSRYVKK